MKKTAAEIRKLCYSIIYENPVNNTEFWIGFSDGVIRGKDTPFPNFLVYEAHAYRDGKYSYKASYPVQIPVHRIYKILFNLT